MGFFFYFFNCRLRQHLPINYESFWWQIKALFIERLSLTFSTWMIHDNQSVFLPLVANFYRRVKYSNTYVNQSIVLLKINQCWRVIQWDSNNTSPLNYNRFLLGNYPLSHPSSNELTTRFWSFELQLLDVFFIHLWNIHNLQLSSKHS